MKRIDNESPVFFDVDSTLIMWKKISSDEDTVKIVHPYSGETTIHSWHKPHVKILRDRKARGAFVVVWSAGGNAWAEAVVKALGLEDCVDLVMTKPVLYVDDRPAEEWMGERLYLPFDSEYR